MDTKVIKDFIDKHLDIVGPSMYGNELMVTDSHNTEVAMSEFRELTAGYIEDILGPKPSYDSNEYKVYYQKMLILIRCMKELQGQLPTPNLWGLPRP